MEEQVTSLKKLNIEKIIENATNADEKSLFILDILKNYNKKIPRWSEITVRMCRVWRFCSPKGYKFCHNNLIKLPSKATISRYIGDYQGQNELIKKRLCTEIAQLSQPIERVCSLILDDMSITEKLHYSRSEDRIYGLDTSKPEKTIGEKPKVANKMLCFVIHGLSTRYTIPTGYFFHSTLTADELYSLTKNVLQFVTDCGFIVLRLVTDNASINVALFKKFGDDSLKNCINHPILEQLPLFLSFDFCHAIKNARNLFLDHNLFSSEGMISSGYLKQLYELQKDMPVKPVKYLTKKHLFPSNFEKMNVLRAIQVFHPTVTSSLRFLKDSGDSNFSGVSSTVNFMEMMYNFFQVHNVSNKQHYIHSLDSSVAPFINVDDERLHWLNITFPNYIEDIQNCSARIGLKGLSKETAHALQFTSKSTYLCIKFLLTQAGFYYVLTRSFSSDAIEATFSHIRLRGGSQDQTDARAAEYALRQILRCGIVKVSASSNPAEKSGYVSRSTISTLEKRNEENSDEIDEEILLPIIIRDEIYHLSEYFIPANNIMSASVAFLSGYIIKKVEQKFACDECSRQFLSTTTPGPLLKLITYQNRGGLISPNERFVGVIYKLTSTIQNLVPCLKGENICKKLIDWIHPHLLKNTIFSCTEHRDAVCRFIITTTAKPVLDNICLRTTDSLKRLGLKNKPSSRKVLKL